MIFSYGKYGNKHPATVVTMNPPEMNRIEITFLMLIDGFSHARKEEKIVAEII